MKTKLPPTRKLFDATVYAIKIYTTIKSFNSQQNEYESLQFKHR